MKGLLILEFLTRHWDFKTLVVRGRVGMKIQEKWNMPMCFHIYRAHWKQKWFRGEIIGEWLKTTPSWCPYFTPNITLLTVDSPKIRAIFSQICRLDSRVESKWFSVDASMITAKCLVYSPWFSSTRMCCHLANLDAPFQLRLCSLDTRLIPLDATIYTPLMLCLSEADPGLWSRRPWF